MSVLYTRNVTRINIMLQNPVALCRSDFQLFLGSVSGCIKSCCFCWSGSTLFGGQCSVCFFKVKWLSVCMPENCVFTVSFVYFPLYQYFMHMWILFCICFLRFWTSLLAGNRVLMIEKLNLTLNEIVKTVLKFKT